MKFLNHNLFTGDITVNGTTTLSTATGVTRATGDNSTHLATTAFVKAQGYATTAALAGYVPTSRTLTINGTTYDLSANRSWTISTADGYISNVQVVGSTLSFTGVGSAFSGIVDLSTLTPTVRTVYETVKNVSGATILKGTPLAVVAGQTSGNVSDVVPADAADPTKMPAVFIANQDIANEVEGEAVLFGNITGVDTSLYQSGTTVYVAPGGGWTATKPVWPNLIQNLGVITKQHATNGAGIVTGVGRANALPNLTAGKIWVGSANYPIESTTVHVDEVNNRVGIGTTSPTQKLDVSGNIKLSNNSQLMWRNAANNADIPIIQLTSTNDLNIGTTSSSVPVTIRLHTNSTEGARLTSGGQFIVGGTTVGYAGTKLQVGNTSDSQNGLNILTSTTGYGYILFGDGAAADTYVGQITYKHGDDYMYFQTKGSEKVRILANGNVGIGTTNPGYKLDVNGSVNFTGFSINSINQITAGAYIEPIAASATWSRTSTADEWVKIISVSGSPRRIRLSLNAGGDNTNMYDEFMISHSGYEMQTHIYRLPGSKYNTSKVAGIKVINPTGSTQEVWVKLYGMTTPPGTFTYSANVAVLDAATVAASSQAAEPTGTPGSSVLLFDYNDRDSYTTMSSGGGYFGGKGYFGGNVGIAITSPTERLDVSGNIKASGFLKVGNSNSGTVYFSDSTSTYINGGAAINGVGITYDNSNGIFLTKVSGKPRVGILTVTPAETLDVKGTARVLASLTIDNFPSAVYPTADLKFGTAGTTYIKGSSDTNTLKIGTAGSDRIYVAADGKIGIGTTSPNYDFDVTVGTSNFFDIRHTQLILTYYNYNFWSTNGFDGNYIISSTNPFGTPNSSAFMIHKQNETVGIGSWLTDYINDYNYTGVAANGFGAKLAVKNDALNTSGNIISAKNIAGSQVFTLTDSGNTGIGVVSPEESIHVAGNIRIDGGSTAAILETNNAAATEAGTTYRTFTTADHYAVFVDYVVYDAGRTNMRTGTFRAVWTTGDVVYTDVSTVDLGATDNVILSAAISGANVNLIVTGPTDYTLKYNLKVIK